MLNSKEIKSNKTGLPSQYSEQFNNDVEDAHSFAPNFLYLCQALSCQNYREK